MPILYKYFLFNILIICFSITLHAQSNFGFIAAPCTSIPNNSCIDNWYSAYGNSSVIKNDSILAIKLENNTGVFTNYNFEVCKYYRVTIDVWAISNTVINTSFTKGLVNNLGTNQQNVDYQILSIDTLNNNQKITILIDSITPNQDYSQLIINNEGSDLQINSVFIQQFCTDSITLNHKITLNNNIFSANKIKIGTEDNLNYITIPNGNVILNASNEIDIRPGTNIIPGSTFEANIKPCVDANKSCVKLHSDQFPITIYNLVTPEVDNKNDVFFIDKIQNYANLVQVFDQNGNQVFKQENYQNNWTAEGLSSGTYLYKIYLKEIQKKFVGNLIIQK